MMLAINIGIFVFLLILGAILLLGTVGALVFLTLNYKEEKVNEDALEMIGLDEIDDAIETKKLMANKHAIAFNAMGITENPKTLYALKTIPEELPFLRVNGYQFLGWSFDFEHFVPVPKGAKLEADVMLFAMWKMLEPEENLDEVDENSVSDESLDLALHEDKNATDNDEDDTDEEGKEEEETSEEVVYNEEKHEYVKIRYKRTYEGRMCNLPPHVLRYYNIVKNKLLSYGLECSETRDIEKFRHNKNVVALLKPSGKGIALYLALKPKDIKLEKYKAKDVSDKKAYVNTPVMIRARNDRRCKYMLELIEKLMNKLSLEMVKESRVNYAKKYTNITKEKQMELGWLIEKIERFEE